MTQLQPQLGDAVLGSNLNLATAAVLSPKHFNPSPYQQQVIDAVKSGTQHIVVLATAGSGKTSLIEHLVKKHINPKQQIKVCAFGKEITEELKKRLPDYANVQSVHSLGFALLNKITQRGTKINVNNTKYKWLFFDYLKEQNTDELFWKSLADQMDLIVDYWRMVNPLGDPNNTDQIEKIVQDYRLQIYNSDKRFLYEALPILLKKGLREFSSSKPKIDMTDMIYLPLIFKAALPTYDVLLVDEAQDISTCQRLLLMALLKLQGRSIWVGDKRQAIFGFAGADYRSIDEVVSSLNAEVFGLPLSYRCPKEVVTYAKQFAPEIEATPGAKQGQVQEIELSELDSMLQPGDFVICRVNYPLVKLAFQLILQGIPAKIKGRDLGAGLKRIIEEVVSQDGYEFSLFLNYLSLWYRTNLAKLDNLMLKDALTDKVNCIKTIYSSSNATSIEELEASIDSIFTTEGGTVTLTTIHGVKGLETNRVFWIYRHLCPHPKTRTEDEFIQENNLAFVAATRAKESLFIVDGEF